MPRENPPAFFRAASDSPTAARHSSARPTGMPLATASQRRWSRAVRLGCTHFASSSAPTFVIGRSTLGSEGTEHALSGGFRTTGEILLITGIGGSLGAVIKATSLTDTLKGLFSAEAGAPVLVSVPARNVLPLPDDWSFAEGAAIGVNHLTAWRMLVTQAQMQPWETVLIFGIGGGVSLAGLQLAKALGARCIVTSRHAGKLEQARALGADHVIDASREDVAKTVLAATGGRGVDVVFENVGEAVWPAAMKSLVRGGRLVTCGATSGDQPGADLRRLFIRQLRVIGSTLGTVSELHDLLAFCQRHGVRPVIEQTFALDQVHAALDRLESGEQFGKIALAID